MATYDQAISQLRLLGVATTWNNGWHFYPLSSPTEKSEMNELCKEVTGRKDDQHAAKITAGDWKRFGSSPDGWDAGCVAYLALERNGRGADTAIQAIPRNVIAAALFGIDADTQGAKVAIASILGNLTLQRGPDTIRLYDQAANNPFRVDAYPYLKFKDIELSPEQAECLGARLIAAAAQIRRELAKPKTATVSIEVEIDPQGMSREGLVKLIQAASTNVKSVK